MVNTAKILERMREVGVSRADIAESLNLAKPTVSQKLRNIRPMFLDEAEQLCALLKIEDCDFGKYFFCREVA